MNGQVGGNSDLMSMEAYALLHFEHKNDVTVLSSSVKFDNDCDVIFMFKM